MTFGATSQPFNILVVDDEEPIRELLFWMLNDAGHTVYLAMDGGGALELMRHQPVDIVLSDVNMPGMDGLELSRRIEAEFPSVPVLLISGRPPPGKVRAFVAKPFRWDELAEAIAALVRSERPHAA